MEIVKTAYDLVAVLVLLGVVMTPGRSLTYFALRGEK